LGSEDVDCFSKEELDHAEVPDSLEPLELSKDVPKHHRDE
jgi:hypothetical protein